MASSLNYIHIFVIIRYHSTKGGAEEWACDLHRGWIRASCYRSCWCGLKGHPPTCSLSRLPQTGPVRPRGWDNCCKEERIKTVSVASVGGSIFIYSSFHKNINCYCIFSSYLLPNGPYYFRSWRQTRIIYLYWFLLFTLVMLHPSPQRLIKPDQNLNLLLVVVAVANQKQLLPAQVVVEVWLQEGRLGKYPSGSKWVSDCAFT